MASLDKYINQAIQILQERKASNEKERIKNIIEVYFQGVKGEIYFGFNKPKSFNTTSCFICVYGIINSPKKVNNYSCLSNCFPFQPKVSLVKSIVSANDGEPFIINQIFVDGDTIELTYREFDIMFYIMYVNRFIKTEEDFISYLTDFNKGFKSNNWYSGGWLHRIISDSKWNNPFIKSMFNVLNFEDGLKFFETDDLLKYGYTPLIKSFKINYANTSKDIITDDDVANKISEWFSPPDFKKYVNEVFEERIRNLKTRQKKYWNENLQMWKEYDGSFEANKSIFLSKFSRFPEYEAKRNIIKELIRKAENVIRIEKGFTVVGTLISESILYKKIKEHFFRYNVISQYRPNWLGRQSLDIYIQELNIAIEYQGDQHHRPIEFYGGIEAFEKTKLRDLKKYQLCKRNGCKLIYVLPHYKIEEVLKLIIDHSKL